MSGTNQAGISQQPPQICHRTLFAAEVPSGQIAVPNKQGLSITFGGAPCIKHQCSNWDERAQCCSDNGESRRWDSA